MNEIFHLNFVPGLPEVPIFDIVVETDAVSASELGQDLHDVVLLTGEKEHLAMMITVIGPTAGAEITPDTLASFGLIPAGHEKNSQRLHWQHVRAAVTFSSAGAL